VSEDKPNHNSAANDSADLFQSMLDTMDRFKPGIREDTARPV